jgi:hypothetical protein
MYKVGDKVRVIHTDYKGSINVGEIKTVHALVGKGGVSLLAGRSPLTFYNSEVEPYKEEVMNTKIEVGDTVEIINNTIYRSEIKKGDKAVVVKLEGSSYQLRFDQHLDNGKPITQISKLDGTDLKLVSKANNMKEVIGYNIKAEYQGQVDAIAKALNTHPRTVTEYGQQMWMPKEGVAGVAKRLGVLDLWFEPVYKSSEVVVKLSGNRTATITSKTVATILISDGSKFQAPAEAISKVLTALNGLASIAGYTPKFKEFELGCQKFTIDDLYAVNKAFTDFK